MIIRPIMSVTRSGLLSGTKGSVNATFPNGTIKVLFKYINVVSRKPKNINNNLTDELVST